MGENDEMQANKERRRSSLDDLKLMESRTSVIQELDKLETASDPGGEVYDSECPVIVLLNPMSGGHQGALAMKKLVDMHNVFVVNILEFSNTPEKARNKLKKMIESYPDSRVVFGGGDGTLVWGFQILRDCELSIPAAPLPFGTGNEFSGCTGWKHKIANKTRKLQKFITRVRSGDVIGVDVWNVTYEDEETDEKTEKVHRPDLMIGFTSWGHDADITQKFHTFRDDKTQLNTRFSNKLQYVKIGIKEMQNPGPKLNTRIILTVDGKEVDLSQLSKSIRCLQILNVNKMANHVDFFGSGKSNSQDLLQEGEYTPPRLDDGKLEIVGTKTIHHMNSIRLNNNAHAIRIAQGQSITVELKEPTPMLIDGEAWINPPGKILITYAGPQKFVRGPQKTSALRKKSIEHLSDCESEPSFSDRE